MWLEWADGRISFIRDYRYVRYVIDDAELVLAPDAAPSGDRAGEPYLKRGALRSTGLRVSRSTGGHLYPTSLPVMSASSLIRAALSSSDRSRFMTLMWGRDRLRRRLGIRR